jgi:hypothetical protein
LVAGVLFVVTLSGRLFWDLLFPREGISRGERLAWSFTIGCALVAMMVAVCIGLGFKPGWLALLLLDLLLVVGRLVSRLSRRPARTETVKEGQPTLEKESPEASARWVRAALWALLFFGLGLYALRALTEPMWSNDFLAIWGLKGKTIFLTRSVPSSLLGQAYGFSHPEYPLGLPLLYAGVAFLTARWDDHALALLFPALQAATLLALMGWLGRRGVPRTKRLAAGALLSLFRPLYSAFTTGMADVPFSCAALLFAMALADSIDPPSSEETGSRTAWRLAAGSFLAAAIKNEGLFLAAAGAVLALAFSSTRRRSIAAAALLPAAAVVAAQRLGVGNAPLRDFDFAFLGPRIAELPGRLADSVRAALSEAILSWPGLLALAALLVAGRRTPFANPILALAGVSLAAYLLLPALAVAGPAWLISTTLARTAAALAPMAAAGITARLARVSFDGST